MGEPNPAPKLCECGCGEPAPLAKANNTKSGAVKGQPQRFIHGHYLKKEHPSWWRGDDVGYRSLHTYLSKHYPKTGICEECGEEKPTEYALIKGRPYSRNREDYLELCKRCHNRYDGVGGSRWRGVETARMKAGDPPDCRCGCGTKTLWNYRKARWNSYATGHYGRGRPC